MKETPQRLMIVTPHPDDFELGCAGTVAKWIKDGAEAVLVVATNGDKGSADPEMTSEKLAAIRREEQIKAAKLLSLKEVVFLDYPDGNLEDTAEFRGVLVRQIRIHQPEVIFTTDPFRRTFYQHRDHRMAGLVTLDAVFPYARDRLHYPEHIEEGLQPHKVKWVYLWGSEDPDTFEDISATIGLKIKALKCHKSQTSSRDGWDVEEGIREWARNRGKDHNIPYAESFKRFNLRD
ncbi:MAG: PIG-L deacetylase family protein [Dehalococcoidia bacterium]